MVKRESGVWQSSEQKERRGKTKTVEKRVRHKVWSGQTAGEMLKRVGERPSSDQ